MDGSSLLARQQALVRYLSDPQAFSQNGADLPVEGIDRAGLRLVGELSLGKRMEKIRSLLPRTFLQIGHDRIHHLAREFAADCPSTSAVRYENAVQFHAYLTGLWLNEPPDPPYLPDLATYEMVEARLRRLSNLPAPSPAAAPGVSVFRRNPQVALLRLEFDIRMLAEAPVGDSFDPPLLGPVNLVLVPSDGGGKPEVYSVVQKVFEAIQVSDEWHSRDPDDEDFDKFLGTLARCGIVEISP